MKQLTIVLLFFLTLNSAYSQRVDYTASKTDKQLINEQVWVPFMQSYLQLDLEQFSSIQSKDLIRASLNGNELIGYEEYIKNTGRMFNQVKERKSALQIEFSFTKRLVHGDLAYETGIYCFKSKREGETTFTPRGFGEFNVILKKENGIWKIFSDADKEVKITYEDFESGEILKL